MLGSAGRLQDGGLAGNSQTLQALRVGAWVGLAHPAEEEGVRRFSGRRILASLWSVGSGVGWIQRVWNGWRPAQHSLEGDMFCVQHSSC